MRGHQAGKGYHMIRAEAIGETTPSNLVIFTLYQLSLLCIENEHAIENVFGYLHQATTNFSIDIGA